MRLIVSYLLRSDRQRSKGLFPLYVRFTLNQKRVQLSTGIKVGRDDWDEVKQLLKPKASGAGVFNNQILKTTTELHDIYNQLVSLDEPFDVLDIKSRFLNEDKFEGLLKTFDYYLHTIKSNIGKGYAFKTLVHYKGSRKKLAEYINVHLRKDDIALNNIDYKFLNGFDVYLKKEYQIHQNTAWNYHKHLKRVLNLAISLEYIEKNPYTRFKVKLEKSHRDFLTLEELKRLENKEIDLIRLSTVRDIFVFACYTGLSYADISKLKRTHIQKRNDGNAWIIINRTKTKTECKIPLFENSLNIISKYADYPEEVLKGRVLPVSSNQKLNSYLKELAEVCGINKNLTMHMARHTFATTVTLSNGVPIETVSKILGHNSLKITQIYARVLDDKISKDMGKLKNKLGW
nr:site-specific integrase [uncultured Marinifilum sp.]